MLQENPFDRTIVPAEGSWRKIPKVHRTEVHRTFEIYRLSFNREMLLVQPDIAPGHWILVVWLPGSEGVGDVDVCEGGSKDVKVSNRQQVCTDLLQKWDLLIDKLDIRIPRKVLFTREFTEVYEASRRGGRSPWRRSEYFGSSADFRPFGYDVRLHMNSRRSGSESFNKLEIYEAGDKSLSEMRRLTASIFEVDPDRLGLMRVDLCADIRGVDVGWFKRHTFVQSKQTNREFGVAMPYMTSHKGQAETLYAGAKPNQYRFYNKPAERMVRWRWYKSQLAREAPNLTPTPYDVLYGHSPDAVITRVERQIVGRHLAPLGLTDFASLKSTSKLSPFDKIVFNVAGREEPAMDDLSFLHWTSVMYVRQMASDYGLPALRALMKRRLCRGFSREWKRVEPFLHVPEQTAGLSSEGLRRAFQSSALKQIEMTSEIAA
jgi:hypothetical protein